MKKLMKNKKGFTLMEMLIVVAIIVILVAISIPVFTSSLNEAKTATDDANMRAAKGLAVSMELTNALANGTYYYDAENGKIESGTPANTFEGYGQAGDNKGEYIIVTVADTGITYAWSTVVD